MVSRVPAAAGATSASSPSAVPVPKEHGHRISQVRALGSQGLCRTPTALAGSENRDYTGGRDCERNTGPAVFSSGVGGWLEDCVVHSATGVPRSFEGRPAAVQGGAGQGASDPGCCALILYALKKKFTLSGLLGKNRVNLGPSLPSWGAEPWETVWGQMATTVSNGLGLERQRTAKGARWLRSRREETELQTHPRNKQRKPGWELCSKRGLG